MDSYIDDDELVNGEPEIDVDGSDVFADGPIQKDGRWLPKGGYELYLHSQISEPDESIPFDGLAEPIDRSVLDLVTEIEALRSRRKQSEDTAERAMRLEATVRLFEGFIEKTGKDVQPLPLNSQDRVEVRPDGSISMLRMAERP